ncbi:MAG TPA: glycosyltransferase family 4 protein [Humibacillus xanthopallidus]|nr:glycosyltransferase family 4 protein [Humibacillus xanthopallidus]
MTDVHVVVPEGIDDPTRPSGGNTYDRRVLDGLAALGWAVHEHPVAGTWPRPDAAALATLATVVAGVPSGGLLLVDGLVASCADGVLVPEASRLRVVVVVHLALGSADPQAAPGERRVLGAGRAVVTTSAWTRGLLLDLYGLDPAAVHVVAPGVDEAPVSPGTTRGGELLCVAAVTPAKGHLDLVSALALVGDLPWRCVVAGALTIDPRQVAQVRDRLARAGLADRVRLVGPLTGAALEQAYAAADLLVLPSLAETYGMVVTEALARGVPVVATSVGGVPEALGDTADGAPGILVPPGDPESLAAALRSWLGDEGLRGRLRDRALQRRRGLTGWGRTAERLSRVLSDVRDEGPGG